MIEMGKKYKTRDGRNARVLCVDFKSNAPVIALISYPNGKELALNFDKNGVKGSDQNLDLIEVKEWEDFKIDEPVMVRDCAKDEWLKRHFAGIKDGMPSAWSDGVTKWTNIGRQITWQECRRPTPEELAS